MSKFYTWNKSGSRMILNTKLKIFNNQTSLITAGNVIADTQYSNYIRPYNKIECNGVINEKGHLRNYDLQYFDLTENVKNYILKKTENNGLMLYEFFFYNSRKERIVVGWIVEQNKQFDMFVNCPYWYVRYDKYESVLENCMNILKEKEGVL